MSSSVCLRRRHVRVSLVALVTSVVLSLVAGVVSASAYTGPVESANARYVVASYQRFLGHDPGDTALDTQLARLAAGGEQSREQVARSLLFGAEGSAREVDRAYQGILGRSADQAGGAYWTDHLQDHDVLDLRVLLMSSDEYVRHNGGTIRDWIAALYRDILERRPESAGIRYWIGEANRGVPRPLIVAAFYQSRESLGNRTDAYYQLVLDRDPSPVERVDGATVIAVEGERVLFARLWASDEAFEPFFDAGWEVSP